jgi:hypothetical protein
MNFENSKYIHSIKYPTVSKMSVIYPAQIEQAIAVALRTDMREDDVCLYWNTRINHSMMASRKEWMVELKRFKGFAEEGKMTLYKSNVRTLKFGGREYPSMMMTLLEKSGAPCPLAMAGGVLITDAWTYVFMNEKDRDFSVEYLLKVIPQRECAGCHKEMPKTETKVCACKAVRYCDKECQLAHWKEHKASCTYKK